MPRNVTFIVLLKRLLRSVKGVAFLEFAFTVPVLIILFLGAVEVSRYILIAQKLESSAFTMGDIITQSNFNTTPAQPLTLSELNSLAAATKYTMYPYGFGANGEIIVSDVSCTSGGVQTNPGTNCSGTGGVTLNWQYSCGPTTLGTSTVGTSAGPNKGTSGFGMNSGEEVVIVEMFYKFTPIINDSITQKIFGSSTTLYRRVTYAPRYGSLTGYSGNGGTTHNPYCN